MRMTLHAVPQIAACVAVHCSAPGFTTKRKHKAKRPSPQQMKVKHVSFAATGNRAAGSSSVRPGGPVGQPNVIIPPAFISINDNIWSDIEFAPEARRNENEITAQKQTIPEEDDDDDWSKWNSPRTVAPVKPDPEDTAPPREIISLLHADVIGKTIFQQRLQNVVKTGSMDMVNAFAAPNSPADWGAANLMCARGIWHALNFTQELKWMTSIKPDLQGTCRILLLSLIHI